MSGSPWAPVVMPRSSARTQCSKSVPDSAATCGLPVDLLHVGGQHRRREERDALVQHGGVAGRPHVVRDHVREPEQVVGAAGPRAPPGGLVPPVLHVPLLELARRGAEQVRADQLRPRQHQRHHVLELVAEAEGAPGLVVARNGPRAGTPGPAGAASGS